MGFKKLHSQKADSVFSRVKTLGRLSNPKWSAISTWINSQGQMESVACVFTRVYEYKTIIIMGEPRNLRVSGQSRKEKTKGWRRRKYSMPTREILKKKKKKSQES